MVSYLRRMEEIRFQRWRRLVTVGNAVAIGVGLLVAFAPDSLLLWPHNRGTEAVFFAGQPPPAGALALRNWLFGIIGGSIAGFHTLAIFISEYALRHRQRWAYRALWAGLLVWFPIDSGVSAAYGAWHNLWYINGPALLMLGVPLVALWPAFRGARP